MRKRIASIVLSVCLCLSLLPTAAFATSMTDTWDGSVAAAFAGGSGTAEDPYQISTGAELAYLAKIVNDGDNCEDKYFELTADIDLNNKQWKPIGNEFANALLGSEDYVCFVGSFDGNGHIISNLAIGTVDTSYSGDVCGLFGAVLGTLENIFLEDVSMYVSTKTIKYYSYDYEIGIYGALAGYASGSITNCHVSGLSMNTSCNGSALAYWVGGLIGVLDSDSSLSNSSVSGTINDTYGGGAIGGFIGELGKDSTISYCGTSVNVSSIKNNTNGGSIGGFIGMANYIDISDRASIQNCYAFGDVTGGVNAGGFAGNLSCLIIKNCYATGNVSNASYGGSFAGSDGAAEAWCGGITNCYATGTVTDVNEGKNYAFAKKFYNTFTNCYYNSDNMNQNGDSATGKTLEEMKADDFVATLNTGDETNGWLKRENGTPYCGAEPADYSAVNTAIGTVPANLSLYTDNSVEALNAALNAAMRGKCIKDQAIVDGYATAINDAISALTYKSADYTAVDAAIARANALNSADYVDFSAVENAVNAVVRNKDITEQDEVNAMAQAIEDAIVALVRKSYYSGNDSPSYAVIVSDTQNGAVKVSPRYAEHGDIVTVAVTPDEGYTLETLTVTDRNGKEIEVKDLGNGKYSFKMPASKVTVNATFEPEKTATDYFADVPADSYYADAVLWAAKNGVTGGIGNGLFAPNETCTRAQIVTFLWRAAGSPVPKAASSFTDVPDNAYYAKAVAWAVENGITGGIGNSLFAPDQTCTRAQAVAFLFRYAASQGMDAVTLQELVSSYGDAAQIPGYALSAFNWALANGIVTGNNGNLMPNDDCTRAQIVTMLYRLLGA